MRVEWNRELVWSERDRRRRRRQSFASTLLFVVLTVGLLLANYACYETLIWR